jgi:hypothetical protein
MNTETRRKAQQFLRSFDRVPRSVVLHEMNKLFVETPDGYDRFFQLCVEKTLYGYSLAKYSEFGQLESLRLAMRACIEMQARKMGKKLHIELGVYDRLTNRY